jgi:predicted transcriptional regulator
VAIQRFKFSGRGLTRVLGALEARIMEAVWQLDTPTGTQICEVLGPDVHYKTVLTVANRLVEKGLLARASSGGRAFRFRAVETRETFLDRISANVASGLVGDFGKPALARFVQAAEAVDPAYLDELERLVSERKDAR